jgi:hypothetical protein
MKKISLVVAVLMLAAPAWATTVTITATDEGMGVVRLDYSVSDANLVRAFGLDITVDTGVITDVNCTSSDYYIYPGSITIVGNTVTDYGTCACANSYPGTLGGIDTNGVTIEMASLYATNDPVHTTAPPLSGELLKFTVSADCNLTILGNAARTGTGSGGIGAVLENPDQTPSMSLPSDQPIGGPGCMKSSHPAYANWSYWNKPDCWCYARQCRGDIDGKLQGPFWVSLNDLIIFRQGVSKLETFLMQPGNEHLICGDIDHQKQGPFWVSLNDLVIFRQYVSKLAAQVPECDKTHINYWTTP